MKTPTRGPLRTGGPVHLWFEANPRAYDWLTNLLFPIAWVYVRVHDSRLTKSGRARRAGYKRFLASLTTEERREMNL